MSKLLSLFTLCLFMVSALARADVNPTHAANTLKGDYKLTYAGTGQNPTETTEFTLDAKLKVTNLNSTDVNRDLQATTSLVYSKSTGGPTGLPVLTVLLIDGSDEDTSNLHLRITIEQGYGERSQIQLLDLIRTFNDGPNGESSVSRPAKVRLFKKLSGTFVELQAI